MIHITTESIQDYLRQVYGPTALLVDHGDIGSLDEQGIKGFGYGKPLRIVFEVQGVRQEAVVSTMKGDKYGHQFYWDRAAILMFQHAASARMERHVRPLGLGYVDASGRLVPVREPQEFFIVNEMLQGHDYYHDLARIRRGDFRASDVAFARELARFLARVHSRKLGDPDLYYRRIRNLIGASECILGLIDEAYPHPYEPFADARFQTLEKRLIDWRWRLRGYAHRLSAVHGDFHPWNILAREDGEFSVLDRSRGEWGEPAGDVACLAINYLLFGILDSPREPPRLEGPFLELHRVLFAEYLAQTGDSQMLEVMAPFFVFRALVVASPEWYPDHAPGVRASLLRFMERVLEIDRFDPERVNDYLA